MTDTQRLEPPRFASWTVDAFAPIDRSDAILGDLREEFLAIARVEGTAAANRWYRRQSARTAVALAVEPFRSSAPSTVVGGFAGILLVWLIASVWNVFEGRFVTTFPVYHFVSAAMFWRIADALPWIATGATLARRMRGQSVSAALATPLLLILLLETRAARPVVMWVTEPGKHLQGLLAAALMNMLKNPMVFAGWFLTGALIARKWPRFARSY